MKDISIDYALYYWSVIITFEKGALEVLRPNCLLLGFRHLPSFAAGCLSGSKWVAV